MPHWVAALGDWAYANVFGNLIASAIWGLPAGYLFLRHHLHLRARFSALETSLHAVHGHAEAASMSAAAAAVHAQTAAQEAARAAGPPPDPDRSYHYGSDSAAT